jgi:pimeloyl-[acyl-carrier protein] synthase
MSETLHPDAEIVFNPFDPQFTQDPYPHYELLREHAPVHRHPLGVVVISRYKDVRTVLLDHTCSTTLALSSGPRALMIDLLGLREEWERSIASRFLEQSILFLDPPKHTRLRSAVNRVFSPRAVAEFEGRLQRVIQSVVESLSPTEPVDLVTRFAIPVASRATCVFFGVQEQDAGMLAEWSRIALRLIDPLIDASEFVPGDQALRQFEEYFSDLIDDRRKAPRDDLISDLAQFVDRRLSKEELSFNLVSLFAAGVEPTRNVIGSSVASLFRFPDQRDRLRNQPSLDRAFVEEAVRFEPPLQIVLRYLTHDIDLGDAVLCDGDRVLMLLGSANRDPSQFLEPASFDIERQDNRPIAFSNGIHYCIGSALARCVLRYSVPTLLRTYPELEPAGELTWMHSLASRGPAVLPVKCGRALLNP